MHKKKLGIVGGMGSHAAAFVFKRLVELTPAKTDKEYIETFIHNNTAVPDRTRGILYGEDSPLPELKRSILLLNNIGVDYIILACITSHYFIPELVKYSKAKIIDGIEETAEYIKIKHSGVKKVGILATTGSIKVSIFQKKLGSLGIKGIILNDDDQETYFMDPVYREWGIKAGHINGEPKKRLRKAVDILIELGAEAIVAGCTEVPLVLDQKDTPVPLVDTIDILVKASISHCLGKVKDS